MRAHDRGTTKGWASYDVSGSYKGRTFQWLEANLSDTTITAPRKKSQGTVGATLNVWRPQTQYGDIFVDHGEALVVNRQSGWAAGENKTRLATTLSNNLYGHTFSGLGGRHANSGWSVRFESAPIASYCDMTNLYGDDSNYETHPSGGSYAPTPSCRNASFAWLPIDAAVFAR